MYGVALRCLQDWPAAEAGFLNRCTLYITGSEVLRHVVEILLVEDNPADVRLVCDAMSTGEITKHVTVVTDGEAALQYLGRLPPYRQAVRPDLILLDLNLPRVDGRAVLEAIKADRVLRHIPVLVLTSSNAESDVRESYEKHANCYLRKPSDLDEFLDLVGGLESYWLRFVSLPTV